MSYISDDKTILKFGDVDGEDVPRPYVHRLQEDLSALGFDLKAIDGHFGRNTRDAVLALQATAQTNIRWHRGRESAVAITFTGSVSGSVDSPTRAEILHWQTQGYRRTYPTPDPLQIDETPQVFKGVTSAQPRGIYWPIRTRNPKGRTVALRATDGTLIEPSRSFGAKRADGARFHVGVDLFGDERDPVIACERGRIVNFYHFYRGVFGLLVRCDTGQVINYGEVARDSLTRLGLKIGDTVEAGAQIGYIGKMRQSSMLHFEMYQPEVTRNIRWWTSKPRPNNVLDPTEYLRRLAATGQ